MATLNKTEKSVLKEFQDTIYQGIPLIDFIKKSLIERDLSNESISNILLELQYSGLINLSESATSVEVRFDVLLIEHYTQLHERLRIGRRIKQLREEAGISQAKLAEMTGLQQQNVARIEAGKYSTGQDLLSKIAIALGKTLDIA